MYVIKRDGRKEEVIMQKITARIERLCDNLDTRYIKPQEITYKVLAGLYDNVTTVELDELAAETAATMATIHPDYAILASRIAISNLHKETRDAFSETIEDLHSYINPKTGENAQLISDEVVQVVRKYAHVLNQAIDYGRDYEYDYFGFKTLERSYLLRLNGKVTERPQQMIMRVSVGIHGADIDAAIKTYHLMSERWFTHATPTLFNAGTPKPQMSSCFLLEVQDDSVDGIYDTLKQCAKISQSAGGIGVSVHNVRATGSYIRGTNGYSNGIVPMLKVFNDTARYIDQGGNKRKGAFAVYLEPWHADVFEFLDLKKNHGKEEARARDLFYALWISDIFMQRVQDDGEWSLFCPNEARGLADCHGKEHEELYLRYEAEGKARKTIRAQELWFAILEAQIETGTPYMLYKDHANNKSNQKNLGTIKSSNLCTEIMEYTAPDEVAVCNLASIALPKFVMENEEGKLEFNHKILYDVTYQATVNLNRIIDRNYYPVEEARNSNMRHRPIGLGVQGLADAFILLRMPFESEEAAKLNKEIFETMYFSAMTASKDLAITEGAYESFEGSPLSKGQFQFDLWNVDADYHSGRWNWEELREQVVKHGARNSLLLAPMPTASTSQILGNNECFEPYTSNIYVRRVLSGEFVVVNKHLLKDLIEIDMWDDQMKNELISANGSVQNIKRIPQELKDIYKTVWEISQRTIIDMSADRGAYICQSQSLNVHIQNPTFGKLTSMHFHAWKRGLKTGMYYLRTKAAADAIKFTVDKDALEIGKALGETKAKAEKIAAQSSEEVLEMAGAGDMEEQSNLALARIHKRQNGQAQEEQLKDGLGGAACSLDDEDCLVCGS